MRSLGEAAVGIAMVKWLNENRPAVTAVAILVTTVGIYFFASLPPPPKPAPKAFSPLQLARQYCEKNALLSRMQAAQALSQKEDALAVHGLPTSEIKIGGRRIEEKYCTAYASCAVLGSRGNIREIELNRSDILQACIEIEEANDVDLTRETEQPDIVP